MHPDRLPVGIQDFEQIKDKYYQLQFFGDSLATRENQGGFKHIYNRSELLQGDTHHREMEDRG